jgi:hypothetical protein
LDSAYFDYLSNRSRNISDWRCAGRDPVALSALKRHAVELLFKWVKQNVRIKHFDGASENAVKTHI